MGIQINKGTGEGPTTLAAFDAALLDAGVANYNLIHLSSIVPPGSVIERERHAPAEEEYGHRLYVVMARRDERELGTEAWAGLGWTQEDDGRGLFVELLGDNESGVREAIESTLGSMMRNRGRTYHGIDCELAGIHCGGRPVCAVVIAVFKAEPWD